MARWRETDPHQYAMVLHTFETDPDPHPSPHPHVHLTVKAADLDGVRLNPRKADLQRWRDPSEARTVNGRREDVSVLARPDRRTRENGSCCNGKVFVKGQSIRPPFIT